MEAVSQSSQISSPDAPFKYFANSSASGAIGSVRAERFRIESAFAKDVGRAHDGVLRVRSGFAFEAERFFEVERDHRLLGVLQHEVAQRADGDLGRDRQRSLRRVRDAAIDFRLRRRDQPIEQVVGLHAEAFASRDFDVGASLVFLRKLVTKFGGAARRERDHLVGEMRVVVGGLVVAQAAQGFDHRVLRFRLARVDDVVDLRYIAEVRMVRLAFGRGDPALC